MSYVSPLSLLTFATLVQCAYAPPGEQITPEKPAAEKKRITINVVDIAGRSGQKQPLINLMIYPNGDLFAGGSAYYRSNDDDKLRELLASTPYKDKQFVELYFEDQKKTSAETLSKVLARLRRLADPKLDTTFFLNFKEIKH